MMKVKLKPSKMFFEYAGIAKDILSGKDGLYMCIYFWLVSPLLPLCFIGFYLTDIASACGEEIKFKYGVTKTQRIILDNQCARTRQLAIDGEEYFDLDQYQVAEYFGDEIAENYKFKEFIVIISAMDRRNHGDGLLCSGWFSKNVTGSPVKRLATIYPEDIIIRPSFWLEHMFSVLNVCRQLVCIKPDFEDYDMGWE